MGNEGTSLSYLDWEAQIEVRDIDYNSNSGEWMYLIDENEDALLQSRFWRKIDDTPTQSEIVFGAPFRMLLHLDFPDNYHRWPIMSKKMLTLLKSLGPFPH